MMNELDELKQIFRSEDLPRPSAAARAEAIAAAMAHAEKISTTSQEAGVAARLRNRMATIWNRRKVMHSINRSHAFMAGTALAAITLLVIGSPVLQHLANEGAFAPPAAPPSPIASRPAPAVEDLARNMAEPSPKAEAEAMNAAPPQVAARRKEALGALTLADGITAAASSDAADAVAVPTLQENRDRFTDFTSNPVKQVATDPLSTFSIDVDTASYSFVRRSLEANVLPPKDAVRVEEMINYFPYDYRAPTDRAEPFTANVSLMQTPWNAGTRLMRIGIKGYSVAGETRPRANLVFLIDTSGSMQDQDKLPLLLNSFRLLLDTLSPDDTVSIVTYAGSAGTVLEPTRASDQAKILAALDTLSAGGSTAGAEGIRQAYDLATRNFDRQGVNRVILATDGDFNVGISDPRELQDFVERQRRSGIYLSVLGFGAGNYNDDLMQRLAQSGNGNAAYIDSLGEARKVLVDEATSTLFPIANDVKIQVEFNPAAVSEYRLIGYETRVLDKDDFNNDKVDAGDIGAGHTVTALYEVTPSGSKGQLVDPLRYGKAEQPGTPAGEYAFVKIRYKLPGEDESRLITRPVTAADERPDKDASFAAAVAAFGQILRGGQYTGSFGYDDVIALASASRGEDPYGYRAGFITLARLAKSARAMQ
ncbi:VWA domain-containing protein [Aestuariivirga litoralis]|uniref:VWA domain-containing protein n=1 Tax=Aestuariivirga litoralis TaxID=2650924 RepID=A0A2W2BJX6_9HYPH|nr:VWA domain-containing protein [Aestuariivirga litoralis]PZF76197.1 VWA domain-containing protein [Aestuariivirga litoralis]